MLISSLLSTLLCFAVYFLYLSILILSISVRCLYSFTQLYFFPVFSCSSFLAFCIDFLNVYLSLSVICPFVSSFRYVFVLYLCIYFLLITRFQLLPFLPYSRLRFAFVFTHFYLPTHLPPSTLSLFFLSRCSCASQLAHTTTQCTTPITSTFPLSVIFNILSNHLKTAGGSSPLSYKHQTA